MGWGPTERPAGRPPGPDPLPVGPGHGRFTGERIWFDRGASAEVAAAGGAKMAPVEAGRRRSAPAPQASAAVHAELVAGRIGEDGPAERAEAAIGGHGRSEGARRATSAAMSSARKSMRTQLMLIDLRRPARCCQRGCESAAIRRSAIEAYCSADRRAAAIRGARRLATTAPAREIRCGVDDDVGLGSQRRADRRVHGRRRRSEVASSPSAGALIRLVVPRPRAAEAAARDASSATNVESDPRPRTTCGRRRRAHRRISRTRRQPATHAPVDSRRPRGGRRAERSAGDRGAQRQWAP